MTRHASSSERWWSLLRAALGVLQMFGAALALAMLILVGVTPVSLSVVVITGLLTTVSVLLFGSRMPRGVRHQSRRY